LLFSQIGHISGRQATPKKRKIVVDSKYRDDWWEGEAKIQMTGYTKATFGKVQQKEFQTALAKALSINAVRSYFVHGSRILLFVYNGLSSFRKS
jgi:hypothetical protein